eukprot:SAG31_NODE_1090_length_9967_cov_66.880726_2_plen_203_part_00
MAGSFEKHWQTDSGRDRWKDSRLRLSATPRPSDGGIVVACRHCSVDHPAPLPCGAFPVCCDVLGAHVSDSRRKSVSKAFQKLDGPYDHGLRKGRRASKLTAVPAAVLVAATSAPPLLLNSSDRELRHAGRFAGPRARPFERDVIRSEAIAGEERTNERPAAEARQIAFMQREVAGGLTRLTTTLAYGGAGACLATNTAVLGA